MTLNMLKVLALFLFIQLRGLLRERGRLPSSVSSMSFSSIPGSSAFRIRLPPFSSTSTAGKPLSLRNCDSPNGKSLRIDSKISCFGPEPDWSLNF